LQQAIATLPPNPIERINIMGKVKFIVPRAMKNAMISLGKIDELKKAIKLLVKKSVVLTEDVDVLNALRSTLYFNNKFFSQIQVKAYFAAVAALFAKYMPSQMHDPVIACIWDCAPVRLNLSSFPPL